MPTLPSWDVMMGTVIAVAVLAVMLERGLSIVFEHPLWVRANLDGKGLKELIALGVAYGIVKYLSFDAISMISGHPRAHSAGLWVTAAVIAGGAKGSNRLFVDLWNIKSNATRAAQGGGP
jgi:hypothetical protein